MEFIRGLLSPRKDQPDDPNHVFQKGDFVSLIETQEDNTSVASAAAGVVPSSGRKPSSSGPLVMGRKKKWGCHAGVFLVADTKHALVYVNCFQPKNSQEDKVRNNLLKRLPYKMPNWKKNRLCVVLYEKLKLHQVEEEGTFPLGELPITALVLVVSHLEIDDASFFSYVCKKFLLAFRQESVWQERARVAMGGEQYTKLLEEAQQQQGKKNNFWLDSCRRFFTEWTVSVVVVFRHRGGTSASQTFSVRCSPSCSVADFVRLLVQCPDNTQRHRSDFGADCLRPYDAKKVGRYEHRPEEEGGGTHFVARYPNAEPNCEFNVEGKDLNEWTIADAGLCNGAILETPERMKRD